MITATFLIALTAWAQSPIVPQVVPPTVSEDEGRDENTDLDEAHRLFYNGRYDAAEALTDQVNTAIKGTAASDGSAYVDLRAAFKGPDYAFDETHYLSNDGDHPNAAGHEQIAAAVVDVVTQTLRT